MKQKALINFFQSSFNFGGGGGSSQPKPSGGGVFGSRFVIYFLNELPLT